MLIFFSVFQSTYGIFLDEVSATLAMNKCLEAELPSLAAQIAYEMMLQEEDFTNSSLLSHMSLLSCLKHWLSIREDNGWPQPESAEEEDEVNNTPVLLRFLIFLAF